MCVLYWRESAKRDSDNYRVCDTTLQLFTVKIRAARRDLTRVRAGLATLEAEAEADDVELRIEAELLSAGVYQDSLRSRGRAEHRGSGVQPKEVIGLEGLL